MYCIDTYFCPFVNLNLQLNVLSTRGVRHRGDGDGCIQITFRYVVILNGFLGILNELVRDDFSFYKGYLLY